MSKDKKNVGRPSLYNFELAEKICLEIATSSHGLHFICKNNPEFPDYATVFRWLNNPKHEEFRDLYARAKEEQAEYMAEETLGIADDSRQDTEIRYSASGEPYEVEDKEWASRSRLRVETRKWLMSKLKPKKFGDKIDVTTDGKALPQTTTFYLPAESKPEKDDEN